MHRKPPEPWSSRRQQLKSRWTIPLWAFEWFWEWVAYVLSNWSFLEALEYLSSFGVLIAVIFYFTESGNRIKQKHYQAWQVINTAQGRGVTVAASTLCKSSTPIAFLSSASMFPAPFYREFICRAHTYRAPIFPPPTCATAT
jgi:hypothetical protein